MLSPGVQRPRACRTWPARPCTYDRFIGMDEIIERIQAVTVEDLLQSANELFRPELIAVTVLGNLNGLKITRGSLAC